MAAWLQGVRGRIDAHVQGAGRGFLLNFGCLHAILRVPCARVPSNAHESAVRVRLNTQGELMAS